MSITSRPVTAIIIIALTAFLTATLAIACSSATPRAGDANTDRAALAALYATNGSSWQASGGFVQCHQWEQLAGQH